MADWAPKRFWKNARTEPVEDGHRVLLDTRPIRTPAGTPLILPTADLADAIAAEWDAQTEAVDPGTMPFTRTANSALDKVAPQHADVATMLAEYGATDLLCYRAAAPQGLAERQARSWDPLLDWAAEVLDARLAVTEGVMPITQDPEVLDRLAEPMHAMSPFRLAAFHDMVALTGSLVLAHVAAHGVQTPSEVWAVSRIDEEWQAEEWGRDDEAEATAVRKRQDFLNSCHFLSLCG